MPFAGHPTIGVAIYLLRYAEEWAEGMEALLVRTGRIPVEVAMVPGRDGEEGGVQGVRLEVAHDVHVHDAPFRER